MALRFVSRWYRGGPAFRQELLSGKRHRLRDQRLLLPLVRVCALVENPAWGRSSSTWSVGSLPGLPEAQAVRVQGWVKSIRKQKRVVFIVLNDGTNLAGVQVVAAPTLLENLK